MSADRELVLCSLLETYMTESEAEALVQHGRVNLYAESRLVATLSLDHTL
jgi:hypothetical protein